MSDAPWEALQRRVEYEGTAALDYLYNINTEEAEDEGSASHVLVRPGQKWLTSDDAARRIAERGFKSVAQDLGVGETTLRATMRADGYVFTRKMIWQEPTLPGLEGVADGGSKPADPGQHEDPTGVQDAVAAGG